MEIYGRGRFIGFLVILFFYFSYWVIWYSVIVWGWGCGLRRGVLGAWRESGGRD